MPHVRQRQDIASVIIAPLELVIMSKVIALD